MTDNKTPAHSIRGAPLTTQNSPHTTSPARSLASTRDEEAHEVSAETDVAAALEEGQLEVVPTNDRPYSVFTSREKLFIILLAGTCAFFSPVSGQIYFPVLNSIAESLHVSDSLVNLTVTTYMIFQGLAPAFIGTFSDDVGRRPAFFICFTIYILANLGLALQNNYAALLVLRCVQSAGSSGTIALSIAIAADIVAPSERGIYISWMSVMPQLGPAVGPVIGGLLGQYLGWHSIFWFLLICNAVVFTFVIIFFPETCRKIVEDGSVPPQKWNRCYTNTRLERRAARLGKPMNYARRDELAKRNKIRFPNPFTAIRIIFMKESGFILIYCGVVYAGLYAIMALIPSQFGRIYNFNQLQIALCYIPLGAGTMLAAMVRGRIIDSRYKKYAKQLNMPLVFNRQVDLSDFPIERARIEVALPTLCFGAACMIGFGWMLQYKINLAGPLILIFCMGFSISAAMNTISVLLVDVFPGKPGAATAALNITRCWLGAGATSGVVPMINKIGMGWTSTFFGLLVVIFSPVLWYVMINGPKWRKARKVRNERHDAEKAEGARRAGSE